MSSEVLENGLRHLVVGEVDMAAASFADGGLRCSRSFQLGATLETGDTPHDDEELCPVLMRVQRFLDPKVPLAFFAPGGVRGAWFLLQMPAVRASHLKCR